MARKRPPFWVLQKAQKGKRIAGRLFRMADGQLCVWLTEEAALAHAELRRTSWETWEVRRATNEDFQAVIESLRHKKKLNAPIYVVMDEGKPMKKKTTSPASLVEIFEDMETRKFAIASKASNESDFIVEVAEALAAQPAVDWNIRLREVLPLIVDLACKYRGYKADTVIERRELVIGDLTLPNALAKGNS